MVALTQLKSLGFVNVGYPESLREMVSCAMDSWKGFCQLSAEDKCTFAFLEDTHGDGAGYELKEELKDKKDRKENFHVTLFQYERLANIANKRTFPFLHNAKRLLDGIEPLVLEFARNVEQEFEVIGLEQEVLASKPFWILRYLHYFGNQQPQSEIAAPHADKGGFTLHLYESEEGLQYCNYENFNWTPMPVSETETVIIPAIQLQLLSRGTLKALYHRVVATENTAKRGRFSMVCFIPFENVPKYNKKTYGSMQTHDIGFNYNLSHEQFSKLFKLSK